MSGVHHHHHHHGHVHGDERASLTARAAMASIAMAVLLIGLKAWAAVETSSMAMLGSLADSGLDLLASLVVLLGVRVAALPADADHRFGHGKAEALYVVKRTGSVAISTDRLHYASDLALNTSVIVALVLDQFAGLAGADAAFGLLIAAWLLWGAYTSSSHALDQLMDREWPEDLRQRFLTACAEYPELNGLHDLRTRTSGTHYFAQFHVWVPGDWTIQRAHECMDRIEEELQQRFPATEILIHLDPEGHTDRETLLSSDLTEKAS